jgi:tripeptidyl-peptidase-1
MVGAGIFQPGIEAELDIQYIMGCAPEVATEFWEQKAMDFCSDLDKWVTLLLADDTVPMVHSISYGWQGPLTQIQCSTAEATEVNNGFAKLAAKGVTIIFASGDSGSGYAPGAGGDKKGKCYPSWPASSPWVTAVGATTFQKGEASEPEMASTQFGSGGGFSDMFDRTDATWQETAVSGYLTNAPQLPPKSGFTSTGRATPDVSALGEGYQVFSGGEKPIAVGGTSASAPTFAGLVSLLNEARIQGGKKALGFLNPFLYANPGASPPPVCGRIRAPTAPYSHTAHTAPG